MKIRFESSLAKNLYIEVSALANMKNLDRPYISTAYIWKIWQKVYKANCGCTRYMVWLNEGRSTD